MWFQSVEWRESSLKAKIQLIFFSLVLNFSTLRFLLPTSKTLQQTCTYKSNECGEIGWKTVWKLSTWFDLFSLWIFSADQKKVLPHSEEIKATLRSFRLSLRAFCSLPTLEPISIHNLSIEHTERVSVGEKTAEIIAEESCSCRNDFSSNFAPISQSIYYVCVTGDRWDVSRSRKAIVSSSHSIWPHSQSPIFPHFSSLSALSRARTLLPYRATTLWGSKQTGFARQASKCCLFSTTDIVSIRFAAEEKKSRQQSTLDMPHSPQHCRRCFGCCSR